jgi:thiol-disulfide isomerase/thioredoxin
MKFLKVVLVIFTLVFLSACGNEQTEQKTKTQTQTEQKGIKVGQKIELTSIMGAKLTLKRVEHGFVIDGDENKILILDIFGTFCHPCQSEASNLMAFQNQNAKNVTLVAFDYYEDVSDEYIKENFASKYNAYYFIVNSPKRKEIVQAILEDINYKEDLKIPFKVVLKNGVYQTITDIYEGNPNNKYYIGEVPIPVIQSDIDKIEGK